MNTKKIFCALLLLLGIGTANAYAAVTGEVLYTNIGALIDDSPIESYNINNYTYVVAEDLTKYGFNVVWDDAARTLSITHDVHKGYELALNKEKINIKKSDIPTGKHYCNVYSTDIKTYLEGKQIDAFNVDGRTMIQIDNLAQYGEFYYDDTKRMVELRIMKPSFKYGLEIAENKVDTVVGFYPSKYRTDVNYTGLVDENGTPDGIGRAFIPATATTTYAYWDNYNQRDTYYSEVVDSNSKSCRSYGCQRGVSNNESAINIYGIGTDPYTMLGTRRYEYDTRCSREGIYDSSYLYGFYITEETFYDSDGMSINYTNGTKKQFTEVMADKRFAQIAYAKTTDGTVYAAGFSGADEDTGWTSSGAYKVFTKTEVTDFPKPPTKPAVENVIQYSAAEQAAYNRIISLSNDGSVYFERTPGAFSEVNKEQSDGLDLSQPVHVFDNAKYVNIQLNDVGNVTGTAYIPYFYVVDSENNLWYWNYEYYKQSKTGNEYNENNGYIAYGRVEYIKEPVKIAENIVKAFGTEDKCLLKTDGSVVRLTKDGEEIILDNVADIDADMLGLNFIALKNDGTIWTWGKNDNGQCGVGHTDYVWYPTQITEVYERLW